MSKSEQRHEWDRGEREIETDSKRVSVVMLKL